jgi:hypothetical protein
VAVDLSRLRDKVDGNAPEGRLVDRTAITFAREAGVLGGVVFWPGTQDEAVNAISDAIEKRAWLRVPPVDGSHEILLHPYALDRVSAVIIMTVEFGAESLGERGN